MLSANELCILAKSDASHDFGPSMVPIASETIPESNKSQCIYYSNEDDILKNMLGLVRDTKFKSDAQKEGVPFIIRPGVNDKISKDYNVILYESFKNMDNVFKNEITSDGNIFFIIDTPGGILEPLTELSKNKNRKGPTYYCIQNRQTLYDPAGKSTPNTKAGKEIFLNNPYVKFAWENSTPGAYTKGELFPSWKSKTNSIDLDKLDDNNILFYCKNDIFQILDSSDPYNYLSQETKCIMKTHDNHIVVMNKEMAKISGGSFTSGSYSKLFSEMKNVISSLFKSNPVPQKFSDKHHCPAKRLGDQGQALSCLKDKIKLKYYPLLDGKTEKKGKSAVADITSDGNHCFVTIDRPALAAALMYKVPLILYSYYGNERFALFIHKSLQSPELLFENSKKEYVRYYALLQEKIDYFKQNQNKYNNLINKLKTDIQHILDTNVFNKPENKLPGAQIVIRNQTITYKFSESTEETHFRRLIINIFKYIKHMEFINALRGSKIITNMSEYVKSNTINALQLNDINTKKLSYYLANIRSDFNEFNSCVAEFDTLEELVNKVPTIDTLNKSNIENSALFSVTTGTSRTFICKFEEDTLREYIKTIIKMLNKTFPELTSKFTKLIKNMMYIADIHSYDKKIKEKLEYLSDVNGLENNKNKNNKIVGGDLSHYNDLIFRTTFAIIYSAISNNSSKIISSSNRVIYDKYLLERIFNDLTTENRVVVDNDIMVIKTTNSNFEEDDYPYYLDFIEAQINSDYDLQNMYELLINKQTIMVPLKIENILLDTLKVLESDLHNVESVTSEMMNRNLSEFNNVSNYEINNNYAPIGQKRKRNVKYNRIFSNRNNNRNNINNKTKKRRMMFPGFANIFVGGKNKNRRNVTKKIKNKNRK
jgi:hypothetical protein